MTCSASILSSTPSPTQSSIALHIPVIATHRGVSVEDMIWIILGFNGVKFLIVCAVEGLFPVHLTGIGLQEELATMFACNMN